MKKEIIIEIHKGCGGYIFSVTYTDNSYWKSCNKCCAKESKGLDYYFTEKEIELLGNLDK